MPGRKHWLVCDRRELSRRRFRLAAKNCYTEILHFVLDDKTFALDDKVLVLDEFVLDDKAL